jgi:hypothetical protein
LNPTGALPIEFGQRTMSCERYRSRTARARQRPEPQKAWQREAMGRFYHRYYSYCRESIVEKKGGASLVEPRRNE